MRFGSRDKPQQADLLLMRCPEILLAEKDLLAPGTAIEDRSNPPLNRHL
jgi:hypothetical protein